MMRPEELLDFIGSSKGIGEGIRRMSLSAFGRRSRASKHDPARYAGTEATQNTRDWFRDGGCDTEEGPLHRPE